jgi:hypothetical protein
VGGLRAVVLELDAQLLPQEIEMIWELIEVGEPAVAYEMLCSQLFEHHAGISAQTVGALSELGAAMNLEPRQWQILKVVD